MEKTKFQSQFKIGNIYSEKCIRNAFDAYLGKIRVVHPSRLKHATEETPEDKYKEQLEETTNWLTRNSHSLDDLIPKISDELIEESQMNNFNIVIVEGSAPKEDGRTYFIPTKKGYQCAKMEIKDYSFQHEFSIPANKHKIPMPDYSARP